MESAYTLFTRGSSLLSTSDYAQAAFVLEMAAELEPDSASIHEALGRAYFALKDLPKAKMNFTRVVEIDRRTSTPTTV